MSLRKFQKTSQLIIYIPTSRPLSPVCLAMRIRLVMKLNRRHYLSRPYPSSRPQIPFLSTPFASRRPSLLPTRYLTTDQKEWVRYQIRLGVYWTAVFWLCVGGLSTGYFVLRQDWLDRQYPSPKDWPWFARHSWRSAQHELAADDDSNINWLAVMLEYQTVICTAENGSMFKAWYKPLPRNEDVDWNIPGLDRLGVEAHHETPINSLSKIGPDMTGKSDEWKQAYFDAMMGFSKSAEINHNLVLDTRQSIVFPKEQMIGPSNPFPRPLFPGGRTSIPPQEKDCKAFIDTPELLYQRILTSKGFSRQQLMKAGLAYAAWLDYRGEAKVASELCQWSLSLACQGVSSPQNIIDIRTGVIDSEAPFVTSNILDAATAMASHKAKNGKTSFALNVYSSILRARRDAPAAPLEQQYKLKRQDYSLKSVESITGWLTSLHRSVEMEKNRPTGDEPFQRTQSDSCEEAALMAYIGEIFFASTTEDLTKKSESSTSDRLNASVQNSGSLPDLNTLKHSAKREARNAGLAWTREAVELAEKGYNDKRLDHASWKRCAQCMAVGLENWHKMVKYLAAEEKRAEKTAGPNTAKGSSSTAWLEWIPFWGQSHDETINTRAGGWQQEEEMVAARKGKFFEERLMSQLNARIRTNSDWFVA